MSNRQDADKREVAPGLYLVETTEGLALQMNNAKPVRIEFAQGKMAFRIQTLTQQSQHLAKAIGKKNHRVLDATAGLGRDAFVLAHLGYDVIALERSSVLIAMLEDGEKRARESGLWPTKGSLNFVHCEAMNYLHQSEGAVADVIYLDPMFPPTKKSALPQKDLQILQKLLGPEDSKDSEQLIRLAIKKAKDRVVVKRGLKAPLLFPLPVSQIKGKSIRFDIYAATY